jgi:LPXTG-site transpeptidase (sortase) family protein
MNLKRVNTWLLAAIIAVNAYTILAPLLPQLGYWYDNQGGTGARQLEARATAPVISQTKTVPNGIIVPSMLLDQPILEGPTRDMYKILDKGIWHYPSSSTPDKGGNTVLLGHRFTYTNPRGVLYFLNKVTVGDTIGITWNNTKYVYKVTRVDVVQPTDTSVIAPTKTPTLTVYTCTPLWSPHSRLVVTAKLEKKL